MTSSPAHALKPEWRDLLRRIGEIADAAHVQAYLVGGPVRDLVMGRSSNDLDLTVEGDGIAFADRVAGDLGGVVKSHRRFGTAVLVFPGGIKVDLATARRESYPRPGALPSVVGGTLREDLYRRDFTINSMALRVNPGAFGELLDPFGGQGDIAAGVIRVLHAGSFADDPTRLYRAVRFAQRFGFRIDPETLKLMGEAVASGAVSSVSGDRIRNELLLVLAEDDARLALERLRDVGLFAAIHPGFTPGAREIALAASMHTSPPDGQAHRASVSRRTLHLERMLALVANLPPDVARAVMARLGLAGNLARWMESFWRARAEALPRLVAADDLAPSALHRLLAPYDPPPLRILAGLADSELAGSRIRRYLEELRGVRTLVRGNDLAALGVPPGPGYGPLLRSLLDARLDGHVRTRAEELQWLRDLVSRAKDTGGRE